MSAKPPSDAEHRTRAGELAARADMLSARAMDVTTALYCPDARGEPEAIGSGVLLALGDARILVTAAHVLDIRKDRLLLAQGGSALIPVRGEVVRIQHRAATTPTDDHVDIGLVRLSGEEWRAAMPSAFLQWSELDHSPSRVTRDAFGIVGYALTRQKNPHKGTELHAWADRFVVQEAPPESYATLGHDPKVSLILGFEKRHVWSSAEGEHTARDLYGVSGGGVWRFGRRLREVTDPVRLSAIVIECHQKVRHKHVLATRIRPIIAALTQRYADVSAFVTSMVTGAA
jgi:hypothetical protein